MNIICISGKAQHGKDTAAQGFKEKLEAKGHKVLLTHYADLLKWMCANYFGWNGQKDDFGRSLLQRVGTDVVRKQLPDFWVNWVIQLLKLFPNEWDDVIIPDCRFPNEINAIRSAFGNTCTVEHVRVERPNFESTLTPEQKAHISETALDGFACDVKLVNTTVDALYNQIDDVVARYLKLEEV